MSSTFQGIEFFVTFDPSSELAASLYERYFQTTQAVPVDREARESAYSDWKAAMEAVHLNLAPPRPPGVTDEEIAESGPHLPEDTGQ